MPIKLLDKKTIVEQKSVERKKEIDEGVKLAKKIDVLRETVVKEESNLSKFRLESLKQLKSDIDVLSIQKNAAQAEITALELKRKQLLEPLDQVWKELRIEKQEISKIENIIANKIQELERKELLQIKISSEISDLKERLHLERLQTQQNLLQSSKVLEKSENKLQEIESKKIQTDEFCDKKKDELLDRESKVAIKEKEISLVQNNISKKVIELDNRERFINDKYQTLLRSQKRLNG